MQRHHIQGVSSACAEDLLDITQTANSNYNPDSHCCERCGKAIWSSGKKSTYRRGITYPLNGKRVDDSIMIPVYLCKKCGKSDQPGGTENGDYHHAILATTLIPFTYYTLLFVLTVLDDYAKHNGTVVEICDRWSISVSTLYRWKSRYMEHYDAWSDSLSSIESHASKHRQHLPPDESVRQAIAETLIRVWQLIYELPRSCFLRFTFSFMQGCKKTHFRELPNRRRF